MYPTYVSPCWRGKHVGNALTTGTMPMIDAGQIRIFCPTWPDDRAGCDDLPGPIRSKGLSEPAPAETPAEKGNTN